MYPVNQLRAVVLAAAFACGGADTWAADSAPLADGQFVTVRNGHLSYRNERLRLWGTNFTNFPKTAGKDLELSMDRMRDAGFNGVRLNLFGPTFLPEDKDGRHAVPVTVKGSGSGIDRLDYAVAYGKRHGMFFWFTLDIPMGLGPADYALLPDDGHRVDWLAAAKEVGVGHLMYFDDRAEKAFEHYAQNLFNHVNPYDGRRYADEEAIGLWEMQNENTFIGRALAQPFPGYAGVLMQKRWNGWLKKKYRDDAGLKQAWGKLGQDESLAKGTVAYAPTQDGILVKGIAVQNEYVGTGESARRYPKARGDDMVRFVIDLYTGHTQRFVQFARVQGRGIGRVPITPSGEYGGNIRTYWAAAACGDFVSMGDYSVGLRPWELKKDAPFYPYVARVAQHPLLEQPFDVLRVPGKPHLLYECNDFRPNPYAVEFPARIAAYAIQNDYDGAFWFQWDDSGYLPNLHTDQDFLERPLPIPDPGYPNAGLILSNDQALLAAVKAAGTLFRSGAVPPPAKPLTVVIGSDILLNLTGNGLGSMEQGGNLEELLRPYAWKEGVRTIYDPNRPSRLPPPVKVDYGVIAAGPYIGYQWAGDSGAIRVDHPAAKLHTGFFPAALTFAGGVKVNEISRNFGTISFIAEDGLPLEKSASILVTAMSRNYNRGQKVSPERLNTTDYWQQGIAQMCEADKGGLPIQVERVGAIVRAPWLAGLTFDQYDFARRRFARQTLTGDQLILREGEPLFYGRLTRPAKAHAIKKILFIGNSITAHGPNADLGWNNSNGMAASSQEKDYVHLVYRQLCASQRGTPPELSTQNIADEGQFGGFDHLVGNGADLIVVELGDNYRGPATVEALQARYEKLLAALAGQGHPKIYCLGTWGNSQLDPFIQAAATKQGAAFIPIVQLSGPANRASTFKHPAVQWHPGDAGMQAIADALWARMRLDLPH